MTDSPASTRPATAIDAIADAHVERRAALDPLEATVIGLPGHDHAMTDLSPSGLEALAEEHRRTLAELEEAEPADEVDVVTVAAMRERLGVELELHAAGEPHRKLNNIASPIQDLRSVFDLMPTADEADWENVALRLGALPASLEGYGRSLLEAAERGEAPAIRQVEIGIAQCEELVDAQRSFFTALVEGARPDGAEAEGALAQVLRENAAAARAAYGRLAVLLREEIAPRATTADAVGRDRYALWSRSFLGARIDLDETYEWGLAELERIVAEQRQIAAELYGPGVGVTEAMRRLDADPDRALEGTGALREWMQGVSDAAVQALADTWFDIPEPVRVLECRIAPTQHGGIYYTGPSADFSRPGRMWWSVPAGVTRFSTWQERTTVYHEGVPGHHLQIGQTAYRSELLNLWRRLACWVSGHGEGWALYAERLMADLGFLDDPGDRMGMLDAQRLRAARVVVDIGVHLGKRVPAQWGEGSWDAESAWRFLRANVAMTDEQLRFERDRYLGWPGQAPSYKVGQRLWERTRDEARREAQANGREWDLKRFHRRALDVGSVGLDVLREALVG